MKSIKLFIILILVLNIKKAHSQSWQWATLINDTGNVIVFCDLAVLPNGDNISIGSFNGKTNASATHSLISNGAYDVCVIKRNSAGNVLWAKKFGGTDNDYGHSICLDKSGNIIIGGKFNQTISFGSTLLTSNGGNDIFLTKLDANGNPIWAKSYGGSSIAVGVTEGIYSLCTDSLNNIYSTGNFFGYLLDFGGGNIISSGGSYSDIFIMKSDSLGTTKWAKSGYTYNGGYDYCEGTSIAISPNGTTLISAGYYRGPKFVFGIDTLINPDVSTNDSYFVSLDPQTGTKNFISNISGTSGYTQVRALTFDKAGNMYMGGNTPSKTFITPPTQTTFAVGQYSIFVFKFSPIGNFIWSTALGGSTYGHSLWDIKINKQNQVLVAGIYDDYIQSGPLYVVNNGGFLAKLDSNSTTISLNSVKNTMGMGWGFKAIGLDSSDNVYAHGYIYGNFSLAATSFTVTKSDYVTCKFGNPNSIVTGMETNYVINTSSSVYPNPSNEYCIINSDAIINDIMISDLNGRIVFEKKEIKSKSYNLNTTDLKSGIYTVQIIHKNSSSFQKLIVSNDK